LGTTFYEAGFVKRPSQQVRHFRGDVRGHVPLRLANSQRRPLSGTAVLLADLGVCRSR